MDPFEVVVDGELFRISERSQPGGALSYDFSLINGPMDGTYVFTVGRVSVGSGGITSDADANLTEDELRAEVRGFVESVYEPGGIAEEDFPDHISARPRRLHGR
ncbi:hypothetical protein [Arthrobacter sp. HLT1-21]